MYPLLAVFLVSGAAGNAVEVTFADPIIEARVRFLIGKPTGPIQDTDLVGVGLTTLDLPQFNISNLSGLEFLLDLTVLRLPDNAISDLSPIAWLTELRTLDLANNDVQNLSALEDLAKLETLDLSGNGITDISRLGGLRNLRALDLSDNEIVAIQPIANMTLLTTLQLQNNLIEDARPLLSNTGLRLGDTVNLKGNPLSEDTLCNVIPALQSRMVTVEFDGVCPGMIEGLVIDAVTRRPIDCAIVLAEAFFASPGIGPVDLDGGYLIDDLAPGDYSLLTYAPGYRRALGMGTVSPFNVDNVEFSLTPLAPGEFKRVGGVVTDATSGQALVGASVRAFAGAALLDMAFTCPTGEYELLILPSRTGTINVTVSAPGYFDQDHVVDLSGITPRSVPLARRVTHAGVILGTVTDRSVNELLPDARVIVKAAGGVLAVATITNDNGEFAVNNLVDGEYAIQVSSTRHPNESVRRKVEILDGGTIEVDIEIGRAPFPGTGCRPALGGQEASALSSSDAWVIVFVVFALLAVSRKRSTPD